MARFSAYNCTVTPTNFTTPKRVFRLSDISKAELRRSFFFMALPLLLGFLMLTMFCGSLLYFHEIALSLIFVFLIGGITFSIGTINLTGLNLNGSVAHFGLYWQMLEVKFALDDAMQRSERSSGRGRRQ